MGTRVYVLDLCANNLLEAKRLDKNKHKEDKEISFTNLCANILLEAQALCANTHFHYLTKQNKKVLAVVYNV